MRNFIFFLTIAIMAQSCSSHDDFSVSQQDCGGFSISSPGGSGITIQRRDTAWWIMQEMESGNKPIYMADEHKVAAFFNVLRDIQVMGLSSKDASQDSFDCRIVIRSPQGRVQKALSLKAVPGSPQMVGSVDGGKCCIVGVPGLRQSPIEDFASTAEYWKDRALLTLDIGGISAISVENITNPAQGFTISAGEGVFSVYASDSMRVGIPQQDIRRYLGSIAGTYRAAQYVDAASLEASDMIYRLKVRSVMGTEETIEFFRKSLPGGQPDFNQMYFRKGGSIGTAKYFDFDRLLVDLDALGK